MRVKYMVGRDWHLNVDHGWTDPGRETAILITHDAMTLPPSDFGELVFIIIMVYHDDRLIESSDTSRGEIAVCYTSLARHGAQTQTIRPIG